MKVTIKLAANYGNTDNQPAPFMTLTNVSYEDYDLLEESERTYEALEEAIEEQLMEDLPSEILGQGPILWTTHITIEDE